MTWSRLDLGVGIVAAPGLDLLWAGISDLVDVIEVEPQTMWTPRPGGGWDLTEPAYQWVAGTGRPALAHGVAFPVGGCVPPDPAGVALAAVSAARLAAAHWSEHLSFNRAAPGGAVIDAGFFLPPAQTPGGVELAASHVASYQAASPLPFLVETGVSYLRPRDGELSDGAFIGGVARAADCGILLDLHNLLANERNGRQPVAGVLAELPLERVLEVHVAGGFSVAGYYLDAHIGRPDGELLALVADVLPRLPNLRALVYEAVPESLAALGAGGIRAILTALHRIWDSAGPARAGTGRVGTSRVGTSRVGRASAGTAKSGTGGRAWPAPAGPPPRHLATTCPAARTWENSLAGYTSRFCDEPPAEDPGLGLLRWLSDQARLGQLTLARPDLLRQLLATAGPDATGQLLLRYLGARAPKAWPADEGAQFAAWLAGQPRP
jgi:uncharacterized protein (UPF0276 family)